MAKEEICKLEDWLDHINENDPPEQIKLKMDILYQKAEIQLKMLEISKSIDVAFKIIDLATIINSQKDLYKAHLLLANAYEFQDNFELTKKHLDQALKIHKKYKLEELYSDYCVRLSSYYRFNKKIDSSLFYANEALKYAQKYNVTKDIADANMLLGIIYHIKNDPLCIQHYRVTARYMIEKNDFETASAMYTNATSFFLKNNQTDSASVYGDSILWSLGKKPSSQKKEPYFALYKLQLAKGNSDSALVYFGKYHELYISELKELEAAAVKEVTEKHNYEKSLSIIRSKNQQLVFTVILLAIILIATILLIQKNSKIKKQNHIIKNQLDELTTVVHQKEVLLSELQHRMKNNLSQLISILEMQKESIDFNNIDELIKGNLNRIHSISLLHKKLEINQNINEVSLKNYLAELTQLVIDSYEGHRKKISFNVECDLDKIQIEKALPLGLIIVELVSNSMKHAFKNQQWGHIDISVMEDPQNQINQLKYKDSGIGFDFNSQPKKGLGLEIIKGLIYQLKGSYENKNEFGFELRIYFI